MTRKSVDSSSLLNSYFQPHTQLDTAKFSDIIKKWLEIRLFIYFPSSHSGSWMDENEGFYGIENTSRRRCVMSWKEKNNQKRNAAWSRKQFVHCTLKILEHVLDLNEACGRRWIVRVPRCAAESTWRSQLDAEGVDKFSPTQGAFFFFSFFFGSGGRGTVSSSIPSLDD